MTRKREVLGLIQAGGQGGRMDVLTRERAKPALPYGGSHRLIDFALTSLVYSDIRDVWVSVEYQVASLDEYLAGGRPWDLDASRGGFRRIVPQRGSGPPTEDAFAYGNGDLLLRISRDIEAFGAPTLVVVSADHVFAADLRPVIADHLASGLACTLLTKEVTKKEASSNVAVLARRDGLVTGLEAKVSRPSTGVVATEIFVYQTEPLLATLRELRRELTARAAEEDDAEHDDGDAGGDSGIGDFADHLLPRLVAQQQVRAVRLEGYWQDLGRPGAYLQAHRDLLAGKVDVFDHDDRPIITKGQDRAPARVDAGAEVSDSTLAAGARVRGRVVSSVLGHGVVVEEGAWVEDSVLFDDVVVRRGARVHTAIVDQRAVVDRDATVGALPAGRVARDDDVALVGRDSVVGVGAAVAAGARLEPGTTV